MDESLIEKQNGILANRCYAYVPTCLAGISFETLIEIFN